MLRLFRSPPALDPEASYAVLIERGVAYGRIPKAGNSQMRRRLVRAGGLARRLQMNRDATWADPSWSGTAFLTGREVAREFPDAYVFTVVRNPFDRLDSCWRNKVMQREETPLGPPFRVGMSFAAFVATAARIADRKADVHIRSQTALLFAGGRPPSLDVYRLETLNAEWARLAAAWAGRGLTLGPVRDHVAASTRSPARWTATTISLTRQRYAADFSAFYADAPDPPVA